MKRTAIALFAAGALAAGGAAVAQSDGEPGFRDRVHAAAELSPERCKEEASRELEDGEALRLLRDAVRSPALRSGRPAPPAARGGGPPPKLVELGPNVGQHRRPGTGADYLEFVEADFTSTAGGNPVRMQIGLGHRRHGWPTPLDIWESKPSGEAHGKYILAAPTGERNLDRFLTALNRARVDGALRPGGNGPVSQKSGRVRLSFKYDNRQLNVGIDPSFYDNQDDTYEFDLEGREDGSRQMLESLRAIAFE